MCNILRFLFFDICLVVFILIIFSLLMLSQKKNLCEMPQVNVVSLLTNTWRVPRSHLLPFPMLFAAIRSRVPSKGMLIIKAHYVQLMVCEVVSTNAYVLSNEILMMYHSILVQAKKFSHDDFARKLRLIIWENILRSIITNLQYGVPNLFIPKV